MAEMSTPPSPGGTTSQTFFYQGVIRDDYFTIQPNKFVVGSQQAHSTIYFDDTNVYKQLMGTANTLPLRGLAEVTPLFCRDGPFVMKPQFAGIQLSVNGRMAMVFLYPRPQTNLDEFSLWLQAPEHANDPKVVSTIQYVLYRMVVAIEAYHSELFVHCDIKPSNFIRDGRDNICLANFDMAQPCLHRLLVANGPKGTPTIIAPELYSSLHYLSRAADMWSYGISIYNILTNAYLYDSLPTLLKYFGNPPEEARPYYGDDAYTPLSEQQMGLMSMLARIGQLPFGRSLVNLGLMDLLSKLLDMNPATRLTATQAVMHPFFDAARQTQQPLRLVSSIPMTSGGETPLRSKQAEAEDLPIFPNREIKVLYERMLRLPANLYYQTITSKVQCIDTMWDIITTERLFLQNIDAFAILSMGFIAAELIKCTKGLPGDLTPDGRSLYAKAAISLAFAIRHGIEPRYISDPDVEIEHRAITAGINEILASVDFKIYFPTGFDFLLHLSGLRGMWSIWMIRVLTVLMLAFEPLPIDEYTKAIIVICLTLALGEPQISHDRYYRTLVPARFVATFDAHMASRAKMFNQYVSTFLENHPSLENFIMENDDEAKNFFSQLVAYYHNEARK